MHHQYQSTRESKQDENRESRGRRERAEIETEQI